MTEQSPAEAIFFAALEKATAEERTAYLDAACGDDSNLRRRVDRLLAAHPQVGSFLQSPAQGEVGAAEAPTVPPGEQCPGGPGLADGTSYQSSGEGEGSIIAGRYNLLETLGQGGMGAVFMARQTEPVKRLVALKLIKRGMDSKQVLTRFEAERQALALMDHPNIAKVLDAGATDSGRPFFVMELVKGVPITRFCDERQLSTRERLELFIPVCQAIQHAHQKGVIHRDIKPTNVLVALYDDHPVPKVIDFGVAKATGSQLTDASLVTGFGAIVGTPEYMSPEQAQLNQLDIDTRSDVYALGVLLYELLTGTTPIDRKRLGQDALLEILRVIREEEPPRPSTRLSTSEALASIAATRKTEPARLAKLMRGELDWIVMKCLEKDRSRRYETANGLARDLERYLHDEVVEAQPPTAGYRLRKFVRKHRTVLATAATIVLLLVAGVAVSTWQAVRATRAERQSAVFAHDSTRERDRAIQSEKEARLLQTTAQQEEDKALKAAAKANAMIRFFKDLMLEARQTVMDYDQSGRPMPGEEKKFRNKRMDEAVSFIDSERGRALFADYPVAEAEIREWIASLAFPTDGEWVQSHSFKGVRSSISSINDGEKSYIIRFDPVSAQRHLERALELYLQNLGPDHVQTLETMRKLGRTIVALDDVKGLQVLGDSVARSTAAFGPDDDKTVHCQTSLAQGYDIAEKPAEAAQLWKILYTRKKAKLGIGHDETQELADRLAAAYEKAGRFQEALRQREESLTIKRKRSPESPMTLVDDLRVIARLYEELHDYKHAEALWRENIAGIPNEEDLLISVKASLGQCLLRCGKPADAEQVLRECLALRAKGNPWEAARIKSFLGRALLGQKKYADAEPLLLAGYEWLKILEGPTDPPYAGGPSLEDRACWLENLEQLVQLYDATGKKDEAAKWRKIREKWKAAEKAPATP